MSQKEEDNVVDLVKLRSKKLRKQLMAYKVHHNTAYKLAYDTKLHDIIEKALKNLPQRPNIQNKAAFLVREIENGGYEPYKAPKPSTSSKEDKTATRKVPNVEQYQKERQAELEKKEREEKEQIRLMENLKQRYQQLDTKVKNFLEAKIQDVLGEMSSFLVKKDPEGSRKMAFYDVCQAYFYGELKFY